MFSFIWIKRKSRRKKNQWGPYQNFLPLYETKTMGFKKCGNLQFCPSNYSVIQHKQAKVKVMNCITLKYINLIIK